MYMTTRERILVGLMIAGIVICLLCIIVGAAQAAGDCELVAEIQPDETEQRVEYSDPQGRELCRLKIYLHDRTVIGFAPPGGEHDGYAAAFSGAHVVGHRIDPEADEISHAQVFAVANSVPPTNTDVPPTEIPPTATETEVPPTVTQTNTPTRTATLPPGITPSITLTATPTRTLTLMPPTLIPPVENPTVTPTATDTPTVDIFYPPPEEGKSPPPAPRLPETGAGGSDGDMWVTLFATAFLGFLWFLMWRARRQR